MVVKDGVVSNVEMDSIDECQNTSAEKMVELLTPTTLVEEIPTQEMDRAGLSFLGACVTGVLTIALNGANQAAAEAATTVADAATTMADHAVNSVSALQAAAPAHFDLWNSLSQNVNTLYESLVM